MVSSTTPPTHVDKAVTNASRLPPRVPHISDMVVVPGDEQLVEGHGPGTELFPGQDPFKRVYMADVFILSKGGGDYRGIGIIKVLCETLPLLINHRIYMSVMYHKALHRFRLVKRHGYRLP